MIGSASFTFFRFVFADGALGFNLVDLEKKLFDGYVSERKILNVGHGLFEEARRKTVKIILSGFHVRIGLIFTKLFFDVLELKIAL